MAALLIKESVNQTVDNMGFYNSLQSCFTLHQLNHSHWAEVRDDKCATAGEEHGMPNWRDRAPDRPVGQRPSQSGVVTPRPMQVTIPDHLFAQLPFFDIVDSADTVVVDLENRADLVNIAVRYRADWSPHSSTWPGAGSRSSTRARESARALRT